VTTNPPLWAGKPVEALTLLNEVEAVGGAPNEAEGVTVVPPMEPDTATVVAALEPDTATVVGALEPDTAIVVGALEPITETVVVTAFATPALAKGRVASTTAAAMMFWTDFMMRSVIK